MFATTLLTVLLAPQQGGQALETVQVGEHAFHRRRLENGLRAVAVRDEGKKVSVFMVISAGKRHESAETTGIAHLTEHAMYTGTARTKLGQHDRMIHAMGGESNAFTREDYTLFYDHNVPMDKLGRVLAMEADRLRGIRFETTGFRYERERLRREEARTWKPTDRRRELLESKVFTTHNYRAGLLDAKGHTSAPTLAMAQVKSFYDTFYHPNRTAVVVVGDLEPKAALDAIEKAFGHLPRGPKVQVPLPEPVPAGPRQATVAATLARPRCHFVWVVPAMGHADRPALQVLARILARRNSEDGTPVDATMGGRVDRDLFDLATTGEQAAKTLTGIVATTRTELLPADEVEQTKSLLADEFSSLPLRARPYFSLGGTFGVFEVLGHAATLADHGAAIRKVTPERLRDVAKLHLDPERQFTLHFESSGQPDKPLPKDSHALSRAAEEAKAAGDLVRAIAAYTRLLESGPNRMFKVIYLTERGQIYRQQKDYDGAIGDFERALRVVEYPAVRKLLDEVRTLKAAADKKKGPPKKK